MTHQAKTDQKRTLNTRRNYSQLSLLPALFALLFVVSTLAGCGSSDALVQQGDTEGQDKQPELIAVEETTTRASIQDRAEEEKEEEKQKTAAQDVNVPEGANVEEEQEKVAPDIGEEEQETELVDSEDASTSQAESQPTNQDSLALAEEYFERLTKAGVFPSFKKMSLGDQYDFTLAFSNNQNEDDVFRVEILYQSAKGKSQASLSERADFASSWVASNQWSTLPVEKSSITYVPFTVLVQETSDDKEPLSGNYKFLLNVYSNADDPINEELYARTELTVQVPETD